MSCRYRKIINTFQPIRMQNSAALWCKCVEPTCWCCIHEIVAADQDHCFCLWVCRQRSKVEPWKPESKDKHTRVNVNTFQLHVILSRCCALCFRECVRFGLTFPDRSNSYFSSEMHNKTRQDCCQNIHPPQARCSTLLKFSIDYHPAGKFIIYQHHMVWMYWIK